MLGDKIIHLYKIDSTSKFLKDNWEKFPNGTIVWADIQERGYGREKKKWISPFGGLWFSVLFKTRKKLPDPWLYVRIYSLAIFDLLEKLRVKSVLIKWPNDILVKNKKLAGIIAESIYVGEAPKAMIVGIGMNVNNEIPEEIKNIAISLKEITGKEYKRIGLLKYINRRVRNKYMNYIKGRRKAKLTEKYLKNLNIKVGCKVEVLYPDGNLKSITVTKIGLDKIEGIDTSGNLVNIVAGEIKIIGGG